MQYTQFVTHTIETMGGERCDAYESKNISEVEMGIVGPKLADHAFILRVMGHLLGKVLTTVEATTSNEHQAKAIKDLMRGHFSEEMEFVGSMLFDQEEVNKMAEESMEGLSDEDIVSVEIEEVLGVK